jgi:hypothetical protein
LFLPAGAFLFRRRFNFLARDRAHHLLNRRALHPLFNLAGHLDASIAQGFVEGIAAGQIGQHVIDHHRPYPQAD